MSVSFRVIACAAINVSSGPIGVPARSGFARIAAYASASSDVNSMMEIGRRKFSIRRRTPPHERVGGGCSAPQRWTVVFASGVLNLQNDVHRSTAHQRLSYRPIFPIIGAKNPSYQDRARLRLPLSARPVDGVTESEEENARTPEACPTVAGGKRRRRATTGRDPPIFRTPEGCKRMEASIRAERDAGISSLR